MQKYAHRSRSPKTRKPRGFTLVELLAVIAIIAILAALLFPALRAMSARGKQTKCMSNMRQWGSATTLYLSDHDGVFPDEGVSGPSLIPEDLLKANAWYNALATYVGHPTLADLCTSQDPQHRNPPRPGDKNLFMCPSMTPGDTLMILQDWEPVFAYGYNLFIDHEPGTPGSGTPGTRCGDNPSGETGFERLLRISQIKHPSMFAVFGEVSTNLFDNMDGRHLVYRHGKNDAVNIVLADGHVQNFDHDSVYLSDAPANKSKNNGVMWNPEGDPDQNALYWSTNVLWEN